MTKRITDLETRLASGLVRADKAKITMQRDIYRKAIKAIIDCNESSCEKYVQKVDSIAMEAYAKAEDL